VEAGYSTSAVALRVVEGGHYVTWGHKYRDLVLKVEDALLTRAWLMCLSLLLVGVMPPKASDWLLKFCLVCSG
jgi:hypothetical protein